jgi:transposase
VAHEMYRSGQYTVAAIATTLGVSRAGLPRVELTACLRGRGPRWKDQQHAHSIPIEFRRDVIAVVRQGEQSKERVAGSFGISASCLARWLRIADREDQAAQGASAAPGGDLAVQHRELRTRTKQLEQENQILRRATAYFARQTLPN